MTSKCSICSTEKTKRWLCFGIWTLCDDCAKDYQDFSIQPNNFQNIPILMEVYFKRGNGGSISYEEAHKEKAAFKFVTFEELFNINQIKEKEGEEDE